MKASDVINSAKTLLLDLPGTRWTPTELRTYLSEGQRKLVDLKPSAYTTERDIDLQAGASQSLPSDMMFLVDVLYNVADPQREVTRATLRDLDTVDPKWRNDPGDGGIDHFVYEPDIHPDIFYVYPAIPADTTATIRLLASTMPAVVEKEDEELPLRDRYLPALIDYVVYRAYQKDNEEPENRNRSNEAYQRFLMALGVRLES